jgi:hypothetical protein
MDTDTLDSNLFHFPICEASPSCSMNLRIKPARQTGGICGFPCKSWSTGFDWRQAADTQQGSLGTIWRRTFDGVIINNLLTRGLAIAASIDALFLSCCHLPNGRNGVAAASAWNHSGLWKSRKRLFWCVPRKRTEHGVLPIWH